jgi:hypothetical protein
MLEPHLVKRYSEAMNIIDIQDTALPATSSICFTSNYGKCLRGSGSFLRLNDAEVRRFAPAEILNLLGFRKSFNIPDSVSLSKQWKLVGNSLDIDCVKQVLQIISPSTKTNSDPSGASLTVPKRVI